MYTQPDFKDISCLFPREFHVNDFIGQSAAEPFADETVKFLNAFSQTLRKNEQIKSFPDVATFAFFCRKAKILNLKKVFFATDSLRLGRGVVFHIAPSNVPVNFAYSLVAGLLAGNNNIIRVPSEEFEQIALIIQALQSLAKSGEFQESLKRIALVRYDRQSNATAYFSSVCDVRVIWGGDETIAQIRHNPLPARAFDVTFADRYSFCIINADAFAHETNPEKIAQDFYNDTYLFDQNACSAPHLVVWLGSEVHAAQAKVKFWNALQKLVSQKYQIQAVMAVDKLTSFYLQSTQMAFIQKEKTTDNSLWRVSLTSLHKNMDEFRCAGGYFSEYRANDLSEVLPIINRKCQTVAVYGIDKGDLERFIKVAKPAGIDRIVPIGRTTDFSLYWDGYDLISTLSRNCDILAI